MATVALIAFWGAVAALWAVAGPRIPLVFIGLWVAADIAWTHFGRPERVMLSIEATLAAILLLVTLYQASRKRRARLRGGSGSADGPDSPGTP